MPPNKMAESKHGPLETNSSDDDDATGKKSSKGSGKSRRELPTGAVAILKQWLLSPEHFTHPYPTPQDQIMLMEKTGIDKKQLKNWFTNARRRIWKPMLKKQLEMGTAAAAAAAIPIPSGAGDSGATVPDNAASAAMQHVAQFQALQQQIGLGAAAAVAAAQNAQNVNVPNSNTGSNPTGNNPFFQGAPSFANAASQLVSSNSIGSLPPIQLGHSKSNSPQLNKTDSHAVLMELFARDQDLVRRAAEAARMKQASKDSQQFQQHPLQPVTSASTQQHFLQQQQGGSNKSFNTLQSLSSWPQFSSVSSLTNLGMLTNVKSITNMSGADLAAQGNQIKKANLAHVKSAESMGRNDSYAFLEVFFDDKSGVANRGTKREREEDNDVGLSLDADESPSTNDIKPVDVTSLAASTAYSMVSLATDVKENKQDSVATANEEASSTLKRAYDDALAARGLLSVSRSNEKLTDLALPPKMQRTLSQEFIKQAQASAMPFGFPNSFQSNGSQQTQSKDSSSNLQHQQYPGQNPGSCQRVPFSNTAPLSDPSMMNASVEVPATTKCAICNCINVDTQLRPCGHMFHGKCLKPSLQTAMGPPRCPIDNIPMHSAVLAVPVDEPNAGKQWGGSMYRGKKNSSTALGASANDC